MNNILLTGASGFIGNTLIQNQNIHRVALRNAKGVDSENVIVVDEVNGDTNWLGAFDKVDSIIHLAGLAHSKSFTESDYRAVNTEGTLRLALMAAEAGVRRFVFVSSIGVNGTVTHGRPFLPSDTANPHNFYAQSKYEAELGLWDIAKKTGLEVVIVRPTLVYGANAPGNFGLLTKLIENFPLLPFGLTRNRRNFISVQNLTNLLATCASHKNAAGHIFLASESETVSIKEFTNAIASGLGKKVYQIPVPVSFLRYAGKLAGKSAMVEQLVGDFQVDSSDLKTVLDWTPPYTMKESMAFLKKQSIERK